MYITRYGHSFLVMESVAGKKYAIDPFFVNPGLPDKIRTKEFADSIDVVFLTHGHFDHITGIDDMKKFNPELAVVAPYELAWILRKKGYKNVEPLGYNGRVNFDGLTATLVPALHSSGVNERIDAPIMYAGSPGGYVFKFENDRTIYHAGDTAMFSDMKLIQDYYQPDTAILPCSGIFTMGPEEVAYVVKNFLSVKTVIPCHTWPTEEKAPSKEKYQLLTTLLPVSKHMSYENDYKVKELLKEHTSVEVVILDTMEKVEFAPL